jgi:CRP-like cAMP-binding protein
MRGKLPLFQITEGETSDPNEFFTAFFNEHENDLVGCGPVQTYPSCTEIFHEDSPANVVYVIERGLVKLSCSELNGRQTIVGIRGRYWLLAAPPVFLGIQNVFTGTTLTPCHLRAVTAKCFLHLLKTNEAFSWEMYRQLSQEIFNNFKKVVEVSSMSANERLRYFLFQLITELTPEESQIQNHFEVPLKHQELAEIIGVSSEHLCRIVKRMEQEGVLRSTKGMLMIKDMSRLISM